MGMGYQGFVKFYKTGPATTPILVLATGASVNLVLEPIYSASVFGTGWYNAAMSSHYADASVRFEGSIDFELQGFDDMWDFMGDWFINERAYPRSCDISPDGARVYQYRTSGAYGTFNNSGMWNTSAGFSTSQGSFVTVSAGAIALDRVEKDPVGGTAFASYDYISQKQGVNNCTTLAATNPLNPLGDNVDPIPFWRTEAQLLRITPASYTPFSGGALPQAGTETVEWSVDLTQNHVVLYTANGSRLPVALLQGPMDVTGSVILYNDGGVFDPILGPSSTGTLTTPYLVAESTVFRVTISRGNVGSPPVYIEIPAPVVEGDDYSIPGQGDISYRTFSLKGLGGRCNGAVTLPPMIMSDSAGAVVAP